jgi:hypothetical protein
MCRSHVEGKGHRRVRLVVSMHPRDAVLYSSCRAAQGWRCRSEEEGMPRRHLGRWRGALATEDLQ